MGWILDSFVEWVQTMIVDMLNMFTNVFLNEFSIDIATYGADGKPAGLFDKYFPLAAQMQNLFMATAIGFAIVIFAFQLFKNFMGPLSDAEHPAALIGRFIVCIVCTWYSYDILLLVQTPMNTIYQLYVNVNDSTGFKWPSFGDPVKELFGSESGSAVILLIVVFLFAIGWNYIKLLLEIAERYVILGVMFYTAPLAFSAMTSASTGTIFKSWVRMVASQYILMFLNIFFLRVTISAIANAPEAFTDSFQFLLWNLLVVGFLRLGQRVDQHLAGLGLSTAQAGGTIGSTVAATVMGMGYMAKGFTHGSRGHGSSSSSTSGDPGSGGSVPPSALRFTSQGGPLATESAAQVMNQNGSLDGTASISGAQAANTAMSYFGVKPTGNENFSKCTFGAGKAHIAYNDGSAVDFRAADGANAWTPGEGYSYAMTKGADGFNYYMSANGSEVGNAYGAGAMEQHLSKQYQDTKDFTINKVGDGAYQVSNEKTGEALEYTSAAMYSPTGLNSHVETVGGFDWNVSNVSEPVFTTTPIDDSDSVANIRSFGENFPSANDSFSTPVTNSSYNNGQWSVQTESGAYNIYSGASYEAPQDAICFGNANGNGYFAVPEGAVPTQRQGNVHADRLNQMDSEFSGFKQYAGTSSTTSELYKYSKNKRNK